MAAKSLNIDNIERVYSGKSGCMCGCNGKYTCNEGTDLPSWQGEINVRSVKIIAGKVLNHPAVKFEEQANCAYVDEGGRMRAVYFRQPYCNLS